jgi:hypothetical protein
LQKTIVQKRIEKGGVWGGRWVWKPKIYKLNKETVKSNRNLPLPELEQLIWTFFLLIFGCKTDEVVQMHRVDGRFEQILIK